MSDAQTLLQPAVALGARPEYTAESPVTELAVAGGDSLVLSRFGDPVWDFRPYFKTANTTPGSCRILWDTRGLPDALVTSSKAATLAYWMYGLYGSKRPEARTVVSFGIKLLAFAGWLHEKGIQRFRDVDEQVVAAYVAWVKHPSRKLKPSSQEHYLGLIEALHFLGSRVTDAITQHPWPGQSATSLAGRFKHGRTSGTEIIPQDVAQQLFQKAEALLGRADALLGARDSLLGIAKDNADRHQKTIRLKQQACLQGLGLATEGNPDEFIDLAELSTACHVVIGILAGMRNHEICSIEVGGYYETEEDGEVIGWVKGESHKTFVGDTEWMVPPVVGTAIAVQERIAAPFRDMLEVERVRLEAALDTTSDDAERLQLALRLAEVQEDSQRIFLGRRSSSEVGNLGDGAWRKRLAAFAKEFGWHLHPHQFRRTFAVFVAHNAMGDLRYLRHHFKHWSMDMTLLYARNERQDQELYDEMLEQIQERKTSVVEHWLDEATPLSGGSVQRLKEYRKRDDVKTLKDRRALAATLSEQISIRGTGHSWCLSDGWGGCGGKGLYDMARCGGCGEGLVDDTHKVVWLKLHEQQSELLGLDDIGPGGRQRVLRDISCIEQILTDIQQPFTPACVEQS